MRNKVLYFLGTSVLASFFIIGACSSSSSTSDEVSTTSCTATDNTTATSTVNAYGCYLRTRDVSSCQATRTAQGLSGYWLLFSCDVTVTKSGSTVTLSSSNVPDYKSYYYGSNNNCYESFNTTNGRSPNPGSISEIAITMTAPFTPASKTAPKTTAALGAVGLARNGVVIFNNLAGPGDNIYDESATFDGCEGHPANTTYHYHIEPPAISNNDSNFIGVMRDGFPVYGKKDADGTTPTLDTYGGHTGPLPSDTGTSLYHYHLKSVSGTDGDGNAASEYFLLTTYYYGTPGTTCSNCTP